MCEHCYQWPHLPGCPNAPEPHTVFICSGCGHEIYEGQNVWHILGEQFCECCIDEAQEVAEYDPW